MGDEFIKYNPFGSYRVGQEDVVRSIVSAYDHREKIVEIKSPTGSGKTLALVAAGRAILDRGAKKIVYTTPLVSLVHQLGEVKEYNIPTLVGKRNYPCLLHRDMTADDCPFKASEEGDPDICPACPYRAAKMDFVLSDFGATTMARFLFDPRARKGVSAVMIDESATLGDALLRSCIVKIPEKIDIASSDLRNIILRWAGEMTLEAERLGENYHSLWLDTKGKPSKGQLREVQSISKRIIANERDAKKCEKIYQIISSGQKWFIDKERNFRVIHEGKLFQDMIRDFDLVVLASGTPTTHLVCDNYQSVTAPHPIDVNHRRVYVCTSIGKMSAKYRKETAPKMARKIAYLHCSQPQNTLVHCGNYETAKLLHNELTGVKTILQDQSDREGSLQRWMDSSNSIFLSVAYTNGIDLKEEKFRTNIIANLPYPNRGDEWLQKRENFDKGNWYNTTVAVEVQQAAGRCARTPEKVSATYILDKNFQWFYKSHLDLFQPWFKEAVVFIR